MAKEVKKTTAKKETVKKIEKEEVKVETPVVETKPNFLTRNGSKIGFLVLGIAIGACVMGIMWPKRIAELSDGTQPIVTIDGKQITANDLYDKLKSSSGLTALLNIIDKEILYKEYDLESDAETYAKEQSEYYYNSYEQYYGYTKDQFLSSNGFADEQAFLDYLHDDYYFSHYYEEYLKSTITDKQIKDYYNNSVFGDRTVFVFSTKTDDNKSILEDIRTALKNGSSYTEIEKKYGDKITCSDLGTITFQNSSSYSETFISTMTALKEGAYSKVTETDDYGSTVVYVTKVADKAALDDINDDVISAVSTSLDAEDSNLYYQAFIKLREEHGIDFSDTDLASQYETYKKQYK